MDWAEWHKYYGISPSLHARLRIVREQIVATITELPAGPIGVVSICGGDGRDLVGALVDQRRRDDVTAWILDTHEESLARGRAAAKDAGLERALRFVRADATLATSYTGIVPADLVVISRVLGHLRHADVPRLIASLGMLCKPAGCLLWNRHLVIHEGRTQVALIRELLAHAGFEELHFEITDRAGFAVGRARFTGQAAPLDAQRVLFEFVGLDRLGAI